MYSGTGVSRDTGRADFVWEVYPDLTPPRVQQYGGRCTRSPHQLVWAAALLTWYLIAIAGAGILWAEACTLPGTGSTLPTGGGLMFPRYGGPHL